MDWLFDRGGAVPSDNVNCCMRWLILKVLKLPPNFSGQG